MGREVKRVPLGFEWPMYTTWWGYLLNEVPCRTCNGSGKAVFPITAGFLSKGGTWYIYHSDDCSTCGGGGKIRPTIEVPEGPGYQLWETVTRGSPISPVFAAPKELARWIIKNEAQAAGDMPFSYKEWLQFIVSTSGPPATELTGKKSDSQCEVQRG